MSGFYLGLKPGRYVVNGDGEPILQKSRTNRGFVVEGVASKYDKILYTESHGFISIQPGAFDVSMKWEPAVECWLDHDEALCLKGCKVELHSTETELNFRLHLDDSELAGHARDLVASGAYTQCSLGWHSSKHVTKVIGGTEIKFVLQGILTHIAVVPSGAIPSTHCQVNELKNCGTLADDCQSYRFKSDNAFTELSRALNRLEHSDE